MQVCERDLINVLAIYVNRAREQNNQQKADAALTVIDYFTPLVDLKAEYENLDERLLTLLRQYSQQCRADGFIEKDSVACRTIRHLLNVTD